MIILDTSVWADHFRTSLSEVAPLLARGFLLHHPFVTGELALGNPSDRNAMIGMLDALPQAIVTGWSELLKYTGKHQLGGTGIGYVDAHLLASTQAAGARLWTRDKRLLTQAERLGLAYSPD